LEGHNIDPLPLQIFSQITGRAACNCKWLVSD